MSRFWNSQDEVYIYKENLKIKNNNVEYLINRINANTKLELHIFNIMNIYEEKLNTIIKELKNSNIDFFSPTYNKNSIYEVLDVYIRKATIELTEINNKLINPKYNVVANTKLMLFLIRKNINKYNLIVNEIKKLETRNLS